MEESPSWRQWCLVLSAPAAVALALLPSALGAALEARQRSAQRRTASAIRTLATACESYAIDHDRYPAAGPTAAELAPLLEPTYVEAVPALDGWGRPIRYEALDGALGYRLESWGRDGLDVPEPDGEKVTPLPEDPNDDIVFARPFDPDDWRRLTR